MLAAHPDLNWRMRTILVHWMWQVAMDQDLSFRIFYLSVQYIRMFLSSSHSVSRSHLQGYGVVAMWIAMKYDDVCYSMGVSDILYLCDNAYTSSDIIAFERNMLLALGFRLELPIPSLQSASEELAAVLMCVDGTTSVYTRRMVCIARRRLKCDGRPSAIRKSSRGIKKNAQIDVFAHVVLEKCAQEVSNIVQFYAKQHRLRAPTRSIL